MISILNKKEWAANLPTGEMDPDNSEVPITKPVGPQCIVCTTIWDSRAAFFFRIVIFLPKVYGPCVLPASC
jgi:hypothetical protein